MKNKLRLSVYFIKLSIVFLLLFFLFGCGGPIPSGPTINSFTATPNVIDPGGSSTLSWTVNNATSVTIDQGIGSVAVSSGTSSVTPGATTTYTLTATNSAGSVTATTKVRVNETKIIQPSSIDGQDAYVYSEAPDETHGRFGWLWLGRRRHSSIYGSYRIYIKFDISSIPDNAVITKAKLKLYHVLHILESGSDSKIEILLWIVMNDWNKNTITWNNQPPTTQVQTILGGPWIIDHVTDQWRERNITGLVSSWVRGTHPNYGLMLSAKNENTIRAMGEFYSSRCQYADKRPILEIKYYIPKGWGYPQY